MPKWKEASGKKAAANLKTTYAAGSNWASDWIDIGEETHIVMQLTYSDTDATSVELKIETEDFVGTTGYEVWKVPGGVGEVDEVSFTVANLPGGAVAVSRISLELESFAFRRFRVRAKQSAGAATGNTLAMEILAGGTIQ